MHKINHFETTWSRLTSFVGHNKKKIPMPLPHILCKYEYILNILWSMDIFFLTTKGHMLLCRLKLQIKAGDLP